jgi:hypothetical protein
MPLQRYEPSTSRYAILFSVPAANHHSIAPYSSVPFSSLDQAAHYQILRLRFGVLSLLATWLVTELGSVSLRTWHPVVDFAVVTASCFVSYAVSRPKDLLCPSPCICASSSNEVMNNFVRLPADISRRMKQAYILKAR